MKKHIFFGALSVMILFSLLVVQESECWGFWAHKRINRLSVFTLPPEMIGFYKKNIDYITEHATDPDKRRYASEGEAPRHYIDLDHYGAFPFKDMPRRWQDAVDKYTEDTLQAYGILPWHLETMQYRLTKAFKDRNIANILRYSADYGHYIGDGHVPLHTTINYNGQLTNQKGIHGFWESRIPEMYGSEYDYLVGRAEYIDNVRERIWEFILDSHAAKDSVLAFEKILNGEFPSDQKYSFEERGTTLMKVYSAEYTKEYNKELSGMVERRMRQAIFTIGSLWFTAWVDAGQPDLNSIEEYHLTAEELNELKKLEGEYKDGKIKGREHGK